MFSEAAFPCSFSYPRVSKAELALVNALTWAFAYFCGRRKRCPKLTPHREQLGNSAAARPCMSRSSKMSSSKRTQESQDANSLASVEQFQDQGPGSPLPTKFHVFTELSKLIFEVKSAVVDGSFRRDSRGLEAM